MDADFWKKVAHALVLSQLLHVLIYSTQHSQAGESWNYSTATGSLQVSPQIYKVKAFSWFYISVSYLCLSLTSPAALWFYLRHNSFYLKFVGIHNNTAEAPQCSDLPPLYNSSISSIMLWNGQMDVPSVQRIPLSSKFVPKPAVHSLGFVIKATEINISLSLLFFFQCIFTGALNSDVASIF